LIGEIVKIAVVIPSYKTSAHVVSVVKSIGKEVSSIIVVDDACPEGSGKLVQKSVKDKRVSVLFHSANQGVGGAMVTGYRAALEAGADIVVKVDGDGQMDPADIPMLVRPIVEGRADYTKGNRFDSLEDLEAMPRIRIFGNAVLSLMSKISTGYWNITDPTNGFIAIHRSVLRRVHLEKLAKGFFFESDMLFRLSLIKAVVMDVAMTARYGTEKSNLKISRVIFDFPGRHFVNHMKRIFYSYYLREWSVSSIELPAGVILFFWGLIFGLTTWISNAAAGVVTSVGSVMLSAVPLILGFQLILAFISYDVSAEPKHPRQLES
jgi:glycosyltransferase involved in cell wall biosynthesis